MKNAGTRHSSTCSRAYHLTSSSASFTALSNRVSADRQVEADQKHAGNCHQRLPFGFPVRFHLANSLNTRAEKGCGYFPLLCTASTHLKKFSTHGTRSR